ncbi:TPA: hypothetical protein KRE82_003603 [Clostridioides difficile]|nr:hypothetical protein [Clostridioides difficile]
MRYRNLLTLESTNSLGIGLSEIDLIETNLPSTICFRNKTDNTIGVYVNKKKKTYNEDTLKFQPMTYFVKLHNQRKINLKVDDPQKQNNFIEPKEQVKDLKQIALRKGLKISKLNYNNTINYIGA